MPIYEFECRECGHHFDHLQKLSDPDPTECPTCHAHALHHMVSAPAFRLAGTGWYETDFKTPRDNQRNLAGDAGSHAGSPGTHHATSTAAAGGEAKSGSTTPAASDGKKAAAGGSH